MRRAKSLFYAVLGLLVGVDFMIHREHAVFLWEAIPGFHAFYGLLSTILIIVLSKAIGRIWLMKREDYYD